MKIKIEHSGGTNEIEINDIKSISYKEKGYFKVHYYFNENLEYQPNHRFFKIKSGFFSDIINDFMSKENFISIFDCKGNPLLINISQIEKFSKNTSDKKEIEMFGYNDSEGIKQSIKHIVPIKEFNKVYAKIMRNKKPL